MNNRNSIAETGPVFASVDEIVLAMKRGEAVILLDDEDRENEGDLVVASEVVTAEHIAFMLQHSRGLICVTIQNETAERLDLRPQVFVNTSPYATAFLTPVDVRTHEERGLTAEGRAATIRALLNPSAKAHDFSAPGNVFPLLAHPAGVFGRRGQTEGSADLARLAGFAPSGVICELLSERGAVLRGGALHAFAARHHLLCTTIEALKQYRIDRDISVRLVGSQTVKNEYGTWQAKIFRDDVENKEHIALVFGDGATFAHSAPLTRIHSECITGDFLGSLRCDCGPQLQAALAAIANEQCGVVVYLRQEGRGIGLVKKLEAYNLQDTGLDTVDANVHLGLDIDARRYAVAAKIITALGIAELRLMTNNPLKVSSLADAGIRVTERMSATTKLTAFNSGYLQTKRERMGHLF